MRVAIQGEIGSFHELAAKHWYGDDITIVPSTTFAGLFHALKNKQAEAAVCAIENSIYGSINEAYDLLQQYKFPIVGEIHEQIHQNLIVNPGADLQDVTYVYSHTAALDQCTDFLDKYLPRAERIQYYDTAAAVDYIKETGDPHYAAIASAYAAKYRKMKIAQKNIENVNTNYTRFLVFQPGASPRQTPNKASLVLRTNHQPGALYQALSVFANEKLNLTKLHSRPIIGEIFKYQFYIDVDVAGKPLRKAITELKKQGCEVIILGEYRQEQKTHKA